MITDHTHTLSDTMKLEPMQDYAATARTFALELPATFNFGRDVVDAQAARHDKPALIWCNEAGDERRFSFSDMARASSQLANLLVRQGVARGDRVMVLLPRIPEWQVAMVACMKIGAIPIPCIEMLTAKDVHYRVNHSEARAAITTLANVDKFDNLPGVTTRIVVDNAAGRPVDVTPAAAEAGWTPLSVALNEPQTFDCADLHIDEPALLYYTSGSTGNPKGVLHATRGIYAWRLSAAWWQTLVESDIKWCTADTGWAKAGTGILFGPWSRGSCVLFYDGRFDVARRLELLAHYRVTVFCGPATEFRHMIGAPVGDYDLSSLRLCVSAGESVNPDVVRQWKALSGAPLLDGYGQTETLMTILNYPCLPVKPGSMGKPIPSTRFIVVGQAGEVLGDSQEGQLAMQLPHPQYMLGYWNDPQRTADATRTIDGMNYWLTGDLGYRDEDGYLFYTGRADDIISSAGYRIGPTEVENALQEHRAVVESAVVASPDTERGEVVKAYVVLREGVEPSEALIADIQRHVKESTAPYKYPRRIEFVESLPKNPSGKLLRRVLRDREFGVER